MLEDALEGYTRGYIIIHEYAYFATGTYNINAMLQAP